MTHSALASALGSQFDDFLFAPIGEDRNDMPVSVLSALARLDVDPWQEAAELARLPRETATQRLASSIAALPDGPSTHLEYATVAARLIALLPRQAGPASLAHETPPDGVDVSKFRAGIYMYVVFIVFMAVAQWIVASRQEPARVGDADASASSAALPGTPPNSGQ